MISLLYLGFAVAHVGVWWWGARVWRRSGRPIALTLVLIAAAPLWYDNARIALGRVIGEGAALYALSVPALAWHWSALPLFVLAAAAVARAAGLAWAGRAWGLAGIGLVAAVLWVIDLPYALGLLFGPVGPLPDVELRLGCIGDAVRYTASLSPSYFCGPDAAVHRVGPGPLVAIVMNVVVGIVGLALWSRRRWPWLALAAGFMFVAAAGGPTWGTYAAPVANVGEIVFVVGLIATTGRFAGERRTRVAPASVVAPAR